MKNSKKRKQPRNRQRKSRDRRKARPRHTSWLQTELLEPRIVLTGSPILIDLSSSSVSDPSDFTQVGDVAFFVAGDEVNGRELWKTDGTQTGTSLVADIRPGTDSSDPRELVEFNGALFFVADDGANGQELWMSDGTESGTVMVRDVNPGEGYQYPYGNGPLQSFPRAVTRVDGDLFFSAEDAPDGAELWISDGTESGTTRVSDIFPGTYTDQYDTYPNSSNPSDLINLNGTLLFVADDGVNGRELWKSDGTASGTVLVKDIYTGTYPYEYGGETFDRPFSSEPQQLTTMNGELLFIATNEENGTEIWKSDGTSAGTVLVKDVRPGADDGLYYLDQMLPVDGTLFFSANDGVNGTELWKSDGTTAGTEIVKDIRPGSSGSLSLVEFAGIGGTVLFAANDGVNGIELWKSDGTEAGTVLVADIDDSSSNSSPRYLTTVGGSVFFSADDGDTGRELWESDGTTAGTVLVSDIAAGSASSNPVEMFDLNGTVLFTADDGSGFELWSVDATANPDEFNATLTIFVNSQEETIPAEIGVDSAGSALTQVRTVDSAGTLQVGPKGNETLEIVTLGDFFATWQNNAGVAGNNSAAVFDETQLFGNVVDTTNTIQMFVNGQVSTEFDDYVIQENDQIVLVYGDNPVVSLNTTFGPLIFELFEDETPGTVDNFLNYVNDGDYINSFFHRSADSGGTDFVIQGGGFSTTSTKFTSTAQFSSVPTDPQIVNEPGISNLRGTIAMAKTGDPDSATSQFFVNLSDTNIFLDDLDNSGGFTVFGQVLDMTNADTIAALPIDSSNASPYGELPVADDGTLVVVQSIEGLGEVSGIKFSDANGNGVRDSGEQGIAGVTIFVDSNNNGIFDSDETSTTTDDNGRYLLQLAAGTYTLAAATTSGFIVTSPSDGSHSVTVEIGRESSDLDFGEAVLSAPSSIDLAASSDTGSASDDNVTSLNNADANATLTFVISGVIVGAGVRLYSNDTLIGSSTASGTVATVTTNGTTLLADGTVNIYATQMLAGSESDRTDALPITVDTLPPDAISNVAPNVAQAEQLYTFDADSSSEGQTGVTYALLGGPLGMAIDEQSGVINWTPTVDQVLPQQFEISVSDAAGNATFTAFNITVLGVIPAFPDEFNIEEDGTLTVDAGAGVLANDGDDESGELVATVVDLPANGSLSFNADGSFTYMPANDFFGTDDFTYLAADSEDESNVALVTINVAGVNDAPISSADEYSATEDVVLNVSASEGVLSNDTDVDGDTLTTSLLSQATNGTVSLNTDGSFSYTPDEDFSGSDSFTYTVNDGTATSDAVFVTLTVLNINDIPTAIADNYSVDEDGTLTVTIESSVLANDTDIESDDLTASIFEQTTNGVVSLNSDGTFTYTPNADFFGTDTFTYFASDGLGSSAAATATISVTAQPDPPVATDDSFDAPNDESAQTFDVLANDTSDPDGLQTLTITSVTPGSAGGVVNIDGDDLSYTAPLGFVGTDTFTYTIIDSDGLSDTATVTVNVTESAANTISGVVYLDHDGDGLRDTNEDGVPGSLITLTGRDTTGESINRTALTLNDGSYSFEEIPSGTYALTQTQPAALIDGNSSTDHVDALADGNQILNIVVSGGVEVSANNFSETSLKPEFISIIWFFASSADSDSMFREAIAMGEENAGNFELADAIRSGDTDVPVEENNVPIANADSFSTPQDTALTISSSAGVLINDTDADGDQLTSSLVSSTTNGSLSLSGDGSFSYTPNADFAGTDTFTYTASDGLATSNVATVTISVAADTNNAPVTVADTFNSNEDETLSITAANGVLANDSDADGDNLTATLVSSTINGGVTVSGDGSFVYTPNSNFNGVDSFTYSVSDGELVSNTSVVTINVDPVNDAPVAMDDTFEVDEDEVLTLNERTGVLANDSDVDGDDLTSQSVTSPDHGSVILNSDGSLTYTPDADFDGTDSFVYQVQDGAGGSQQATATINVRPVNDAPTAIDDMFSTDEDMVLAIDSVFGLLANDTDVEGNALNALLVDAPANGTVTVGADGSFTYTPNEDFSGIDSFEYVADDGSDESDPATVTIEVLAIDDPSTIVLPAEFVDPETPASRIVGEFIFFVVSVDDPDDSDYVFQLDLESSGIPEGEAFPEIDATTGQFTWTPTSAGQFELRIIVVNGDGEANQETILIDILADSDVGNDS